MVQVGVCVFIARFWLLSSEFSLLWTLNRRPALWCCLAAAALHDAPWRLATLRAWRRGLDCGRPLEVAKVYNVQRLCDENGCFIVAGNRWDFFELLYLCWRHIDINLSLGFCLPNWKVQIRFGKNMDVKRQSIFFALEQGMTGIASDIMWQPRKFHNSVHVYILSGFLLLLGGSPSTPGDSTMWPF